MSTCSCVNTENSLKFSLVSSSILSKYNNGEINIDNETEYIYDDFDRVIKIIDTAV